MYIPLKFKLFMPVLFAMLGMGVLYHALTLRSLQADRVKFGMEMAQSVGGGLRDELATLIRFRMEELNQLTTALGKPKDDYYSRATTDFRSDVANITVYTPGRKGFTSQSAPNGELLEENELPEDLVEQLNEENPLDIDELAKGTETSIINRSLATEEGPVGILTFVLYSKTMDGKARGPIVVADLLAQGLAKKLRRSPMVQAFLVGENGSLLAHAEAEKMVEYRHEAFPDFPQKGLPENWMQGARLSWMHGSQEWITVVTPTALQGAFLVAQVDRQTVQALVTDLNHQAWLVMVLMGGGLLLLSLWLASGISRNAHSITAALGEMAAGKLENPPKIYTLDEFVLVHEAFRNLLPGMKSADQSEFDRGFKEAELATIQTLRATMGNPTAGSFENWEMVTHRPAETTSHYEFWDFYGVGNRRQVIVGRANTAGVSGILLTLMVRVTLNNIRRMGERLSAQRSPSLPEILDLVNGAIFTAFKGKAALVATAFEVDLDSGKLNWIHAGGPGAIRWNPNGGAVQLDEKSLPGSGASLGSLAVCSFQSTEVFLAPGERLLMAAPLLQTQSNTGAMAQERLRETLIREGSKPLAAVKESVVSALNAPIFAQSLVFVGIRRPTAEENASVKRAA